MGGHRRLLAFISVALVVDTAAYAAITPLLPHLTAQHHLSKAGAGILSAAYAVGNLVVAVPSAALSTRIGPKRLVLGALGVLALASLSFAIAPTAGLLVGARLLQGFGAAAVWAGALAWVVAVAPRERRGEAIGTAVGAAIAGSLGGPVLGTLASEVGQGVVFGAFVAVPLALTAALARLPEPASAERLAGAPLRVALRDRQMRRGMWTMAVPACAFATVNVLVPLRMDRFGAGALAIGATFLAAVVFEAAMSPLVGRAADRRGPLWPARIGLASAGVLLALLPVPRTALLLALVVLAAAPAIGMLWTPAMALLQDGAEHRGIDAALAFGLANLAWGAGATVGGSAGGALAGATSDAVPFVALAAVALLSASALGRRTRDPVVADRARRV